MIHVYPRALGWLVRKLGECEPVFDGVLWDMLPYGGSLTAANDD